MILLRLLHNSSLRSVSVLLLFTLPVVKQCWESVIIASTLSHQWIALQWLTADFGTLLLPLSSASEGYESTLCPPALPCASSEKMEFSELISGCFLAVSFFWHRECDTGGHTAALPSSPVSVSGHGSRDCLVPGLDLYLWIVKSLLFMSTQIIAMSVYIIVIIAFICLASGLYEGHDIWCWFHHLDMLDFICYICAFITDICWFKEREYKTP